MPSLEGQMAEAEVGDYPAEARVERDYSRMNEEAEQVESLKEVVAAVAGVTQVTVQSRLKMGLTGNSQYRVTSNLRS